MWAAVSLYMEPCYDASCGLWRAENKTEKRIARGQIQATLHVAF